MSSEGRWKRLPDSFQVTDFIESPGCFSFNWQVSIIKTGSLKQVFFMFTIFPE